jgi:glycosyltransferase 2 family protein
MVSSLHRLAPSLWAGAEAFWRDVSDHDVPRVPCMKNLSRLLYWALALVVAVWCGVSFRGDIAHLSLVPLLHAWDLILLACVFSLLNYVFRILRWQRYLGRLGHALPFRFIALTYLSGFAFTLSPGKVGEMVRARYYTHLGISLSTVAGAFFVERLMDLLAMLVLASLILTAAQGYQAAFWSAAALIVIALALLGSLPWAAIAESTSRRRFPAPVARVIVGTAKALHAARSLLSPGLLLLGFSLALVAWGLEGMGLYTLASIAAPAHSGAAVSPLTPAIGVGIYAVAILVGAISFLPGGLGSTEAVMTALFVAQGYAVADALLITLACRLVTLWFAVGIGWGAVAVLRQRQTVTA